MNAYLSIEPVDTFFFRDAKPFFLGDESWADGVFPPLPHTVLGAIRTWAISLHPDGLTPNTIEWVRDKVRLKQMFFLAQDEVYFPMPLDLVREAKKHQGKKTYEVIPLHVKSIEEQLLLASSYHQLQVSHLLTTEALVEEVVDGLILHSELESYLNGILSTGHYTVRKVEDYLKTEPKTGIGRSDETHVAEESMLYRVGMNRVVGLRLLVEVELPDDLPFDENRAYVIKLGAENKAAVLQNWQDVEIHSGLLPDNIELSNGRFKLYLATPSVFVEGWKPDLSKHGIKASLVAAAVGKPLLAGGFDMAARRPKPMVRAVPAGSVYYYETEEPTEKIMEKLFGRSVAEPISFNGQEIDLVPEGFGMAYVGKW